MTYIKEIAYYKDDRSEVPNRDLAKKLANDNNKEGLDEISNYLMDKNKSIASDCLKVLYEASYINPALIVDYFDTFKTLLNSKNNRMVWGAMIAISSIATVGPEKVYEIRNLILNKIEKGTVITNVHGVYAIIHMAAYDVYYPELKETLFELQKKCRPVDFAKRAESMKAVIRLEDRESFVSLLESRKSELSKAAQKRVQKVVKSLT
ncbi:MAG: hypothetical protein JEZ08_00540 [Clostridiales bacterium]|nr:hypothetical protein [Clostridiales bacterium]